MKAHIKNYVLVGTIVSTEYKKQHTFFSYVIP